MEEPIAGAQPEQTMKERCVTISLDRYNELVDTEEAHKLLIKQINDSPLVFAKDST